MCFTERHMQISCFNVLQDVYPLSNIKLFPSLENYKNSHYPVFTSTYTVKSSDVVLESDSGLESRLESTF